ncbi:MAG: D-alanine--D-alanine ligase [Candidatus Krumholzibacteriia bacterium]
MRVLLLHNAVSPHAAPDEADVLAQVEAVAAALKGLGHETAAFGCSLDLQAVAGALAEWRPGAVFNLVESLAGHGRLIHLAPAVVEASGVPLAGCPTEAIFLTSHKLVAKECLQRAGLPTPAWLGPDGSPGGRPPANEPRQWIVKSVWEDASLGMDDGSVITGTAAARDLLRQRCGTAGAPWFAEAFVEGREFNIALLDGTDGPRVLPPAEMLFADYPDGKPRIVGYAAKWHADSFEYGHTVRTFDFPSEDRSLLDELTDLCHACWRSFGLRGWARVDFRVDADGRPWILEVNANPCLAPDAGYVAAVERAGSTFPRAVAQILATAAADGRRP